MRSLNRSVSSYLWATLKTWKQPSPPCSISARVTNSIIMESSGVSVLAFLSRQTRQDRSGPLKSHLAELVAQIWKLMAIHRILDANLTLTFSPFKIQSSPSRYAVVCKPGAPDSSQFACLTAQSPIILIQAQNKALTTPCGSQNTKLASGTPSPSKKGSKYSLNPALHASAKGVRSKPVPKMVKLAPGSTAYSSTTLLETSIF